MTIITHARPQWRTENLSQLQWRSENLSWPQWRTEHLNFVDHGVAPSDRYVEKLRVKKNAEVMLSHDSNDTGGDGFGEGDDVGDSQGNVLA